MRKAFTIIKRNAKTVLIATACTVAAFLVGVHSNDANTYAASAIANVTPQDHIELLQSTIARQERRLYEQDLQIGNNIRVIPFEYDDCIPLFLAFYREYPSYHMEDEKGTISIDFDIVNPEEEAANYCMFIIDEYAAMMSK